MRAKRSYLSLLAIATWSAAGANASFLFNNIGDTFVSNFQLTEPIYQSFSTDATNLTLDDLQLVLDVKGPDSGTFSIGLYSDSSTTPGTLLLSIVAAESDTSLSLTTATYDFPIADFGLSANTRYWIGLVPSGSIEGAWESSNPQGSDTGVAGEFNESNGIVRVVGPSSTPATQMSVDAFEQGAVPEPSTGPLLGTGLAAGAALLRKMRRQSGR